MSTIEPVKDVDFTAEVTAEPGGMTVRLVGTADLNVRAQLDRFLSAVHEEAQRARSEEVTVDLRALEFMNSSCLKSFVRWISAVQERAAHAYRITFLSSPTMYWQRRSLHALACLAPDLVSVQV